MMIEHICAEPDIYRIEVPLPNNPLRYLNSYVVRGRDRFLVIDTGFNRPECREALFTGLDSLRVDLARTDLFLTHLHADHTGLVGDFARAGSRISCIMMTISISSIRLMAAPGDMRRKNLWSKECRRKI